MRKSIIQSLFPNIGFQAFLGGLCIFLLIPPNAVGIPPQLFIAELLLLFLMLLHFDFRIVQNKAHLAFAMTMVILYLYMAINSRELSFNGFVFSLMLPLMMWAKTDFVKSVFDAFTNIYVYLMLFSCVVYILVLAGFPLPHENWSLDDATSYTIVDVYAKICGVSLLRFCAYFQEPGVVGTISAVILIAYRFKLKPLFLVVLIFSGIASFSFAFFAIVFLYVLLCSRSWKVIVGAVLVIGTLYLFLFDSLDELILTRLQFDDGALVTNRTKGDFSAWYASFKKTNDYYWGLGGGSAFFYNYGGASYKDLIVDYGIIFFVTYLISYVLFSKAIIKNFFSWIAYLLVVFVILYQRPFIVLPTYLFLLYAPAIVMSEITIPSSVGKSHLMMLQSSN